MKDLQKTIKQTVKEAISEAIQEKKASFEELPFHQQITETVQAFGGFSKESFMTAIKFIECFSVFFVLVNSLHQLRKELKSKF